MDMEHALKMLGESKETERAELLHTVRVDGGVSGLIEFFWRVVSCSCDGL